VGSKPEADSETAIVITRKMLRRIGFAGLAIVVVAGVAVGAYFLGRNSAPSDKTASHRAKSSTSNTTTASAAATTTAPTTTTTAPPTTTTTAPNPALAVLSPATVPPVSAACTIAVTISADGNASPQLCPNGGVNVAAWNWYRNSYPSILALGPSASQTTVIATMCSASPPYPEIENAAKLAGAYCGWSFVSSSGLSLFPFATGSSNECTL